MGDLSDFSLLPVLPRDAGFALGTLDRNLRLLFIDDNLR